MIWLDGHYDMVGTQEQIKYGRTSGVDFGPVDHVNYAEAFGATGLRIQYPDEIASTWAKPFDTPGPCSSKCMSTIETTSSCLKTSTREASCNCSNG